MASSPSLQEQKRQLALRLDASRHHLESGVANLRLHLSPARRLRGQFRDHPLRLFGLTTTGVAAATLLVRSLRHRKNKPRSPSRILLGFAWSVAKPALRLWILDQVRGYLHAQHTKRRSDSLLGP